MAETGGSAYVPGQAMPQDQATAVTEAKRIEDPTYVDQARQSVSGVQQDQSVLEQVQNDEQKQREKEDPSDREKGHTDDDRAMLDSITGMMLADPKLRLADAEARYNGQPKTQPRVPVGQRDAGQFVKPQQSSPDLLGDPPATGPSQTQQQALPEQQQQEVKQVQHQQPQTQTQSPPQQEAPLTQQEIYIAGTWQINADAANRMGRAVLHDVVADLDRSRTQMHQSITQIVEDRQQAKQLTAEQHGQTAVIAPLADPKKTDDTGFDPSKADEIFDEDAAAFIKAMDKRQTDRVSALQAENQQLREEESARQKTASDATYYRWFDEKCNQASDGFGGMLGNGSVVDSTLTQEANAARSRLHGLVAGIGQNSPHLTKDQVFDAACNASAELQTAKTTATKAEQEQRIVQRNGQIMGTPETRQQITDDEPWTGEPNQDPVIHNWFNQIAQENGQW